MTKVVITYLEFECGDYVNDFEGMSEDLHLHSINLSELGRDNEWEDLMRLQTGQEDELHTWSLRSRIKSRSR